MSGLSEIGVRVVAETGNAIPLLHEIAALLETLARDGKGGSIDLGSMPMLPGDRAILEEVLGRGEVSAEIDALGPSRIRESAVRGVWWVTHCNAEGETVADLIEVAHVPTILVTPEEDLHDGLLSLREKLVGMQ